MLLTCSGKQLQFHTTTDMLVVKNDNVHIETEI